MIAISKIWKFNAKYQVGIGDETYIIQNNEMLYPKIRYLILVICLKSFISGTDICGGFPLF